jgi:hypothetical protein
VEQSENHENISKMKEYKISPSRIRGEVPVSLPDSHNSAGLLGVLCDFPTQKRFEL